MINFTVFLSFLSDNISINKTKGEFKKMSFNHKMGMMYMLREKYGTDYTCSKCGYIIKNAHIAKYEIEYRLLQCPQCSSKIEREWWK